MTVGYDLQKCQRKVFYNSYKISPTSLLTPRSLAVKLISTTFSSHRYGNIEVHIRPFWQPNNGVVVRQLFVNSYAGNYNQGSVLHLLKTPSKTKRPELWESNLGVNNNLLQVLGLLKCTHIGKRRIPSVPDDSDEEFDDDNYDQLLNLRADIVDESD